MGFLSADRLKESGPTLEGTMFVQFSNNCHSKMEGIMLNKKSYYVIYLFFLTAVIMGQSVLEKQTRLQVARTYNTSLFWIIGLSYVVMGALFALSFLFRRKSNLKPAALTAVNLLFATLNIGLYFYCIMHLWIPSSDMQLVFSGLLICSSIKFPQ